MSERTAEKPIIGIDVSRSPKIHAYRVGLKGITKIEAFTKPGQHADIPYIGVWKGDQYKAEFCQHNICGVYYATSEEIAEALAGSGKTIDWKARAEAAEARLKDIGDWSHDRSTGPAIPDDLWEIRRMAYDL